MEFRGEGRERERWLMTNYHHENQVEGGGA